MAAANANKARGALAAQALIPHEGRVGNRRRGTYPSAAAAGGLGETAKTVAGIVKLDKEIEFRNYVALSATGQVAVRRLGVSCITFRPHAVTGQAVSLRVELVDFMGDHRRRTEI